MPDAGAVPMPSRLLSRPAVTHISSDGDDEVAALLDTDWCEPFSKGWEDSIVNLKTSCDLEAVSGQLVGLVPDDIAELAPEIFDDFVPKGFDNGIV